MLGFFSKRNKTAHLGEDNSLYYNEELKRWVERGKEHELTEEALAPPPVVSSLTDTVSQLHVDKEADPSSRYVVAGGFGNRTADSQNTNEGFSLFAPAAISAPKTTGFFVPEGLPSERNPPPTTGLTEKYKGFRIPKFEKPEGLEGTQEEYEENELKKWKAKIEKREARKQNLHDSEKQDTKQGTGSGKLDDAWMTNNQQNSVTGFQDSFNFSAESNPVFLQSNATVPLFPVHPGQDTQSSTNPDPSAGLQMEVPEQNGQFSVMSNNQPAQDFNDPIDFSSWDKPAENPAPVDNPSILKTEDNPYSEAEFPGGICETEDPYDIAWLTQTGWTDHAQCKAITLWMCQTYEQEWRSWHRTNPIWDQFWCWYYDGGDEIIYPAHTEEGPQVHGVVDEFPEVTPESEDKIEEVVQKQEVVSYIPEEDGDIWEAPEPQEAPIDLKQETSLQEAVSCSYEVLTRNPGSKLSSWEDALMFSGPDLWPDSPITSDDESDNGILPFAVFTHNGMLQFLQELDSIFRDLNHPHSSLGEFHQQVKQLLRLLEAHSRIKGQSFKSKLMSNDDPLLIEDLKRKEESNEGLKRSVEASKDDSTLLSKLKELEELVAKQQKSIEVLRSDIEDSKNSLKHSAEELEKARHEVTTLEGKIESKNIELSTLRDQLKTHAETNNHSVHPVAEECEKLKKDNKILKKKLLSLMKKSEGQSLLSNPSSPTSIDPALAEKSALTHHQSDVDGQLTKQINVLKRKVLQQKKALEEKETQISQFLETENAKSELQRTVDELREDLEKKDQLIEELRVSLRDKEAQVLNLRDDLNLKVTELETLMQKVESETVHKPNELEIKDQKLSRMEAELLEKQQDIERLKSQLECTSQKDATITKLTSMLGENDLHIQQLRTTVEDYNKREVELFESLSAKDIDLENLVVSLMISQKQISQLRDYCSELGGTPNAVLIS